MPVDLVCCANFNFGKYLLLRLTSGSESWFMDYGCAMWCFIGWIFKVLEIPKACQSITFRADCFYWAKRWVDQPYYTSTSLRSVHMPKGCVVPTGFTVLMITTYLYPLSKSSERQERRLINICWLRVGGHYLNALKLKSDWTWNSTSRWHNILLACLPILQAITTANLYENRHSPAM